MQNILLHGGSNPPHGVSGEAETAIRIEAFNRLHHSDISFGNQFDEMSGTDVGVNERSVLSSKRM